VWARISLVGDRGAEALLAADMHVVVRLGRRNRPAVPKGTANRAQIFGGHP
jgi:hypothetical protein